MEKVSVVIPVYNAEKYLAQCLDSVLSQSLREIEVICVDDGSTDKSWDILADYAQRDIRLKVMCNEKNMYAGPCRNRGLEKAGGEYVLFMDSDDWLLPDALEQIYKEAKRLNADVLRCKSIDYNNETGEISETLHNALKRVPFFMYGKNYRARYIYWLLPKLNVAPWGGIFRRKFLVENNIRFNDLICVNDRSFYWESMLKAERIAFSKVQLVKYRTNLPGSLIGTRIKHFECHFKSYDLVCALPENSPAKMRRCILNAELLDISHWLEQAKKTSLSKECVDMTKRFSNDMEKTLWNNKTEKTKWYKRFDL